jgi:predicted nucleic acid-binding Zn ribbon protein
VSEVLNRLAQDRGWQQRLRDGEVHERWSDIVGADLAGHAQPVRLHGGVLVVRVASAAWATQLRYLAPRLVARANEVLGEQRVRRVQVIPGPSVSGR